MKIRTGFVTNSSSSSYIVINASEGYEELIVDDDKYVIGEIGETEFGWEVTDYRSIHDRINFACIQAEYRLNLTGNVDWLNMLSEVILSNSDAKKVIFGITDEYSSDRSEAGKVYGYIDHQSAYGEGENVEMFFSKQRLTDFIFGKGSYIHGDNDNH